MALGENKFRRVILILLSLRASQWKNWLKKPGPLITNPKLFLRGLGGRRGVRRKARRDTIFLRNQM